MGKQKGGKVIDVAYEIVDQDVDLNNSQKREPKKAPRAKDLNKGIKGKRKKTKETGNKLKDNAGQIESDIDAVLNDFDSSGEPINMPEDDSKRNTENGKGNKGFKQWFKRKGKDPKADEDKLTKKLNNLFEKLKNEKNLSPLKRIYLENKIDKIHNRILQRQQKDTLQENYETKKDLRNKQNNERLITLNGQLNAIFYAINAEQTKLNDMLKNAQKQQSVYEKINGGPINKELRKANGGREIHQFNLPDDVTQEIKGKQELLKTLKKEREEKTKEINDNVKDFIEKEKEEDAKHKTAMKKYKPSLWRTIKEGIGNTARNVKQFIIDVREERDTKKEAVKNMRETKQVDSISRTKEFREGQHVPEENLTPMPVREPGADGENERPGNGEHEESEEKQ